VNHIRPHRNFRPRALTTVLEFCLLTTVIGVAPQSVRASVVAAPGYHVLPSRLAAVADPCGFQSRVWGHIQEAADLVATIQKKIDSDTGNANDADVTYYQTYFRDSIRDMAHDFGNPVGWKPLMQTEGAVAGRLRDALLDYEQNGPNGDIQVIHIIKYHKYVQEASDLQQQAWAQVKGMCAGGNGHTALGLINYYSSDDFNSSWFTAPARWVIVYHYDCTGLRDYSDGRGGSGHFLLTIRTAGNNLVATAANEQGRTAWGIQRLSRPGRFYLRIQSNCYWHISVRGG